MDPAAAFEAREIARNSFINEMISVGDSPTQQFYKDATVLVTGGSGFLGRQFIEKILRSCEIKKLIIILRSNRHGTAKDRLIKLLEDPVYETLRKIKPTFASKVEAISGDITKPRLDINDEDWRVITEEVTFIFHGAATIAFTEPLKKAAQTNVRGIVEIISLAKECKKLKSCVHISTAYSHATENHEKSEIREEFYKSPMTPNNLLELVETTDENILAEMTPKLIKGWPNTYTFTKAVAEEAVRTMGADLPICIVRPAIVLCAYREPSPGWNDKSCLFGGPTGILVGTVLGALRVIYVDDNTKFDLVPVDMVNNAVIAAARDTVARRERGDNDIRIYTVTSSRNSLRYGKLKEVMNTDGRKLTPFLFLWYQFSISTTNRTLFKILFYMLHYISGLMLDGLLLMLGKKPILTKLYKKFLKLSSVFEYFSIRTWCFSDSNLRQLYFSQSPTDRTIFNFELSSLNKTLYICIWMIGCRKYIIKDGLKGTRTGVKIQYCLKVIHYLLVTLAIYMLYKFVVQVYSYFMF